MLYHQTTISSSVDIWLWRSYFDYIWPHGNLENSKAIVLHHTLISDEVSPYQVWLQKVAQFRTWSGQTLTAVFNLCCDLDHSNPNFSYAAVYNNFTEPPFFLPPCWHQHPGNLNTCIHQLMRSHTDITDPVTGWHHWSAGDAISYWCHWSVDEGSGTLSEQLTDRNHYGLYCECFSWLNINASLQVINLQKNFILAVLIWVDVTC